MDFSERLKELRSERKISQAELAKKIGVAQSVYARYETGERKPVYENLIKVSEYFGVSTDFLLGNTDDRNPQHREVPDVLGFHEKQVGGFTEDEREEIDNFIQYVISKRVKE